MKKLIILLLLIFFISLFLFFSAPALAKDKDTALDIKVSKIVSNLG